ncbi:hypothetical protein D7X25_15490 [bacterium 1XD42-8]|jgi:stage V sporulation protein AB|nr:hypothetical protein [Lachnospiraceae bacterium]RKJ52334.1 hypothetical protein D7X25_15490 [bacterium 1XD42-8]
MWIKEIFLILIFGSFGFIVSAGVFTVLLAVGLIPRFAGKTHTGDHIFLYEEMVVAGSIIGNLWSVFQLSINLGQWFLILFGFFAGIFVGCLALAIAEMLDTIPIFARRIGFRHGLGIVVLSVAFGKMLGSLIYFFYRLASP